MDRESGEGYGTCSAHVGSIFAKLGISQQATLDRRVTAVLTYLRDSAASTPGT